MSQEQARRESPVLRRPAMHSGKMSQSVVPIKNYQKDITAPTVADPRALELWHCPGKEAGGNFIKC
jgi:hypothetical protein